MASAEVDRVDILLAAQIPKMNAIAVFVGEQVFGNDATFELRLQRPVAADHVVPGRFRQKS